jgi:tetraacyldisaccharide 4'-kinase
MRAGALLAPLGGVYGGIVALRAALYGRGILERHRLSGPVVSVGNLSVGGSGKTPVVALVAGMLRDEGLPVAVLSRGYGGSFAGEALLVSDGRAVLAGADEAGDEPAMLARRLTGVVVAVGPRRERVGRLVEERCGRRVHVLDDGFQHLRVRRDLDLVCVSGHDLEDRPLPAGRLRERPSAARRASALLVEGEAALPAWNRIPAFRWRRRVEGFTDREGRACEAPARPFLLAAIARPERFAADASAHGAPAGQEFFRDHHRFTPSELESVAARARAAGADAVLTTDKDVERLPPAWSPLPVVVMRIAAVMQDPRGFRGLVLGAVRSAW